MPLHDCPTPVVFTAKSAHQCGVTGAMYVVPQVRINGLIQDLPKGMVLDPSVLPISTASGSAFSVAIPNIVQDTSASIPSAVVGTDNFLLANPTPTGGGWLLIAGTTNKYIPFYQF